MSGPLLCAVHGLPDYLHRIHVLAKHLRGLLPHSLALSLFLRGQAATIRISEISVRRGPGASRDHAGAPHMINQADRISNSVASDRHVW